MMGCVETNLRLTIEKIQEIRQLPVAVARWMKTDLGPVLWFIGARTHHGARWLAERSTQKKKKNRNWTQKFCNTFATSVTYSKCQLNFLTYIQRLPINHVTKVVRPLYSFIDFITDKDISYRTNSIFLTSEKEHGPKNYYTKQTGCLETRSMKQDYQVTQLAQFVLGDMTEKCQ